MPYAEGKPAPHIHDPGGLGVWDVEQAGDIRSSQYISSCPLVWWEPGTSPLLRSQCRQEGPSQRWAGRRVLRGHGSFMSCYSYLAEDVSSVLPLHSHHFGRIKARIYTAAYIHIRIISPGGVWGSDMGVVSTPEKSKFV